MLAVAGPLSVVVGVHHRPRYLWWVGISKREGKGKKRGGAYHCRPCYLGWVGISKQGGGEGGKRGGGIPSSIGRLGWGGWLLWHRCCRHCGGAGTSSFSWCVGALGLSVVAVGAAAAIVPITLPVVALPVTTAVAPPVTAAVALPVTATIALPIATAVALSVTALITAVPVRQCRHRLQLMVVLVDGIVVMVVVAVAVAVAGGG